METIKLMNMCKICDKDNKKVLVQERIKDWDGIAFPGGKVELGESIIPSVIREIKEETGLDITNVKICGIKDWYNSKKQERYLILLFTTSSFTGELLSASGEGKNIWVNEADIEEMKIAADFDILLKVFNDEFLNEMVYKENSGNWNIELY